MGSFQTLELIETVINYQESIKRCICIIYDPQRTKTGSLKVIRSLSRAGAASPRWAMHTEGSFIVQYLSCLQGLSMQTVRFLNDM